jgi:hypothetical protein
MSDTQSVETPATTGCPKAIGPRRYRLAVASLILGLVGMLSVPAWFWVNLGDVELGGELTVSVDTGLMLLLFCSSRAAIVGLILGLISLIRAYRHDGQAAERRVAIWGALLSLTTVIAILASYVIKFLHEGIRIS